MITFHKTHRITNTLLDFFTYHDEHNWVEVEKLLADTFVFDHSRYIGGDPLIITPRQFREMYEHKLEKYILHTQTSNYRIHLKDKAANASCYFTSFSRLTDVQSPDDKRITRLQVGTMDFHLYEQGEDWIIDMFRIKFRFTEEFHADVKEIVPIVTHHETLKYRPPEEITEGY